MMSYWCNGEWQESMVQAIPVTDRGWLHGYGLFETLLAVDGRPVFLDRHLARLEESCRRLGWSWDHAGIGDVMKELLVRNRLASGRARIRLAMSGGSGDLGLPATGADRMVTLLAFRLGESHAERRVMVSPWTRNEHSPLAGLKCASYAENLIALQHARQADCDETILLNSAGFVCEAATANVFLVKGHRLLTPDLSSGCLPGVTRAVIIEQARSIGIPCDELPITREDLDSAEEIFLTSSTSGVVAVTRLDRRTMAIGPLTSRMREAWSNAVATGC